MQFIPYSVSVETQISYAYKLSSLGDRTRELGVHVTPTDFTPEQMKEVLSRCKTLWNEKTLSRLAIPEMLE